MTLPPTPYDEVPYRSYPIEWTAPERLALASLLHGGPRQRLDQYSVLELGCGDGTNLIPMAYYRRHAEFVGIDAAHSRIAIASEKRTALQLDNVSFIAVDLQSAAGALSGQFDFIIAHGVFSWVSPDARHALLELCAERLRPGGLLYVNYNATPGWNVRGLIRDFLLASTTKIAGLGARTETARAIAARMAQELSNGEHPYTQILANEFRFVGENHPSHTAHEYLAVHNHAYSRRTFLNLAGIHGFAYVADADFNYPSGRLPEAQASQFERLELEPDVGDLWADLVYYRQLHSPILTRPAFVRRPPTAGEFGALTLASELAGSETGDQKLTVFEHPSGCRVEAKSEAMARALAALHDEWPAGTRLDRLFADVTPFVDDLAALHRTRLVELRLIEPSSLLSDPATLHEVERRWGDHATSPSHIVGGQT
jgi:SAM-dependent methyltransferase